MDFEERMVNERAEWWEEVTAIAMSVPVIVRDGRVEEGWQGEHG